MRRCVRPFREVASEDRASLVDQHRVGESEGFDVHGNLSDLLLRLGSGIARLESEIADGDLLDVLLDHWDLLFIVACRRDLSADTARKMHQTTWDIVKSDI